MTAETSGSSRSELESIVGGDGVRPADGETVDAIPVSWVVAPDTVETAAAVLRLAGERGWAVIPRGSGTKMSLGNPPKRADLILETRRLNRVLEYSPGDLVVQCQAGVSISGLQAELAQSGQRLAVNPPYPQATLGGIIATRDSGPLRLRYGSVRDLLIGVTYLLPDGTIARAGGKVVKNVAGYDLCKLFTGSLGTLGLIAECIWRLHPLPAVTRTVMVTGLDPDTAQFATLALMHSNLVAGAISLFTQGADLSLAVLIEGLPAGVEAQTKVAADLLAPFGSPTICEPGAEPWRKYNQLFDAYTTVLKIGALPADLANVLGTVETAARSGQIRTSIWSEAAIGISVAGLDGAADQVVGVIESLRRVYPRLTVLKAPIEVTRQIDAWGTTADALAVMWRVKERFDPRGTLNPGRFVGGI